MGTQELQDNFLEQPPKDVMHPLYPKDAIDAIHPMKDVKNPKGVRDAQGAILPSGDVITSF